MTHCDPVAYDLLRQARCAAEARYDWALAAKTDRIWCWHTACQCVWCCWTRREPVVYSYDKGWHKEMTR